MNDEPYAPVQLATPSDESPETTPVETAPPDTTAVPPQIALGQVVYKNQRLLISVVSVLGAIALWTVASLLVSDPVILPSPVATVQTLVHYLATPYPSNGPTLLGHAERSLERILIGFTVGTIVGIALGAVIAAFKPMRALIDPFIELTRPLPPLAYIPVLVVWFGIGELPKLILIVGGVIPIVTVSTAAALVQVPGEMLNAARCLGASGFRVMTRVRIRSAAPHIITGMRLAMGISWTSIVAAEYIAATSGLGYVILQASQFLDTSLIFAGIIVIGLLGISLDGILRLVLRLLDPTVRKH